MVRTRHRSSADFDDQSPRKFISLNQDKGRFISKSGESSTSPSRDAQSPHEDEFDGMNVFEGKVVDSRLRPRRAYNYLDADSSDDEIQMRIRQASNKRYEGKVPQSRRIKEEMMEDHQLRCGRTSRSKRSVPEDEDIEDEEVNVSTRRSLRHRRPVYDTLDQPLLKNDRCRKSNTNMKDQKIDSDDEPKDQESDDDAKEQETEDNLEFSDMYSRVKRKRVRVKRNMYGIPTNDSDSDSEPDGRNHSNNNKRRNVSDEDDDEDEDEKGNESSRISTRSQNRERSLQKKEPQQAVKSYSLREHKPRTDLYKAPVAEKRHRKIHHGIFDVTPTKKTNNQTYQSPALRRNIKKRSAIHSSSTSTSSSDSESNDEKNFKRRKAKSMAKARSRMMPMNLSTSTPPSNIIKDRVKSGASLADVEPMNIDKNITFNSIGGLGKHIRALKEMVVFPLLYDKVFQRFKVDPPRGVLFYGPPGTGKTLVARALANECSHGDKRVAFFMRKGADCLSKWVGESERQLRLLFDQAYKFRPSIIFFDEIDGLAPVRSSRQDQIHSSIVSTLLALMDGLDSRGEIVVIGATNRIDSLDPALRRPGRFDREFLFPLPTLEARKQILKIHTGSWNPKLNDAFIGELAEKCVGYCGADLKALCTEAAMLALRRRYPQIYISNEALQLDESSINVSAKDFFDAIGNIVPTSQRACDTPARALSVHVRPLLQRQLDKVMNQLGDTFPLRSSSVDSAATSHQIQALAEAGAVWDELASDEDEDTPSIFVSPFPKGSKTNKSQLISADSPSSSFNSGTFLNFTSYATSRPATFRPRLLLTGQPGQGQTTYLAPAVIHRMEDLPVHVLDLPALYAVTAKTPEESCANVFHEAKRKSPSIIYLPYINQWWDVLGDTLRATLLTLIHDLNPSMPLLLLATSEQPFRDLDPVLQSLFSQYSGEVVPMTNPNVDERRLFFKDLLMRQTCRPPPQKKQAGEILKLFKESKRVKYKRSKCFQPLSSRHSNAFAYQGKIKTPLFLSDMQGMHSRKYNDVLMNKKVTSLYPNEFTSDKKFNDVTLAMSCHQPAPKSIHRMVLRPRGNFSKLNRNHSARHDKKSKFCHILQSRKSRVHDCMIKHDFKKSEQSSRLSWDVISKYPKWMQAIELKCDFGHPHRGSLDVAGPSNDSILNYINLQGHFSNRNRRYLYCLHRSDSSFKQSPKLFPHTSRSCHLKRHLRSSRSTLMSNCLLSCGSSQMLYKMGDRLQHHCERIDDNLLPVNFEVNKGNCMIQKREKTLFDGLACSQRQRPPGFQRAQYNLRTQSKSSNSVGFGRAKRMLEVLPKAAPVKPRELTEEELHQLVEKEELTLMELRIFLRDVLNKLGSDRKFSIFAKPVNIEDAPDYLDIIEHPMDLSTMMSKIDLHEYTTVHGFMDDIDLICSNALEYNPNRGPMDRIIRHRACALKDTAYAIIKTELDKDFEKLCLEIQESRKRRGAKSASVPNYYYTKPASRTSQETPKSQSSLPSYLHQNRPPRSIPKPEGERFSRRVRGLTSDPVPRLEEVERIGRMARASNSPMEDGGGKSSDMKSDEIEKQILGSSRSSKEKDGSQNTDSKRKSPLVMAKPGDPDIGKTDSSNSKGLLRKKTNKCIWCKPRRKRRRLMFTKSPANNKTSGEEDVEEEISQEDDGEVTEDNEQVSPYHQALRVDVSDNFKTDDSKSTTKKSPRINCATGSPLGVITRRQSLSPRGASQPYPRKAPDKEVNLVNAEQTNPIESTEISSEIRPQQEFSSTKECITPDVSGADSHLISLDKKLRDSLTKSNHSDKTSVVKRLDLDSVLVDSGAGSSLESNGDSRDSMDHKLERNQVPKLNTDTPNVSNNCNSLLAKHANSILNEQSRKLEVPMDRLKSLLKQLILQTDGYNVECLEKIYSCLSQVIYRHRHQYDRTDMVLELERKVDELSLFRTNSSPSRH